MGNKSSPELILSLLLMAALYLEAFTLQQEVHCPPVNMTWPEARLYCQEHYIDMVTMDTVDKSLLTQNLIIMNIKQVWIGLLRDPEKDSVWKWINLKTGSGITGESVSQSSDWADGEQSSHCASVSSEDLMWYSVKCSGIRNLYCTAGHTTKYENKSLSWHNASLYCQDKSGYLATVKDANAAIFTHTGWIGLYREAGETWSWVGNMQSPYRNWAPGQPLNADCASFDPLTGMYYSHPCSKKFQFLCYDDNLVVVNEVKTWENAVRHCQNIKKPCFDPLGPCMYEHSLLSLQQFSNYKHIRDKINKATTDEVWIGLRFLGGAWWWVSGQKLKYNEMPPNCPSQWKHCGTMSKHDTHKWLTRDCSEKRNFICKRVKFYLLEVNYTTV